MDFLIESINSIKSYVDCSYEIIIIDNNSQDKTQEIIPALDSKIKFFPNKNNVGFSKGNNQGFSHAVGDYILLLNPDAKLMNSDMSKAINFLHSNPNIIIGPKILNPDLTLQQSVLNLASVKNIFLETFFLRYFFPPKQNDKDFALLGACLLMKKEVYEKLNGFDENLFWMDDVDFCYRAKTLGIDCIYFTEWSIIHDSGQSIKKNYNIAISNQLISKLKFFKKHRQILNFIISVILSEVQIILRIVLFFILSPFKDLFFRKFLAYCYSQAKLVKYIFTGG